MSKVKTKHAAPCGSSVPATTYNEIDEYAARWIGNLITNNHVARGTVDTRSIRELTAEDVRHVTQAHFFAGIAVWSAAARAAGWPDDVPLWTGSCPCQPFSQAGRGGGVSDERHLWPEWFRLIRECHPPVIVGEQVASPAGLAWLDAVFADLEGAQYACAAVDFGAASVGAPHQRQRLYFVAVSGGEGRQQVSTHLARRGSGSGKTGMEQRLVHGVHGDMDVARGQRRDRRQGTSARRNDDGAPPQREESSHGSVRLYEAGATGGFWGPADWLPCRDRKYRPVEPGTFPLVNGAPARVGRLRAYGNAIVRPQAQAFLETVIEVLTATTEPTAQITKASAL